MNLAPGGQSPSRGFTLLEMLIVLAVVAALAALSWPALRSSLGRSELQEAAKQLRVELAKARLQAIESGAPQQFRYQMGQNHFERGPVQNAAFPSLSASPAANAADSAGTQGRPASQPLGSQLAASEQIAVRQTLPDGVVFGQPDTRRPPAGDHSPAPGASRAVSSSPGDLAGRSSSGEWSEPIVFYPNGRATNSRIRLRGTRDLYVDVTLRGLTGIAKVGELQRDQERSGK